MGRMVCFHFAMIWPYSDLELKKKNFVSPSA